MQVHVEIYDIDNIEEDIYAIYSELITPATIGTILDACDKARINPNGKCVCEFLDRKLEFLDRQFEEPVKVSELAFFLNELSMLNEKDIPFLETIYRKEYRELRQPLPNLTLIGILRSINDCVHIGGVSTDRQLGKFLYENDMLSDEVYDEVRTRLSYTNYPEACYESIGRKHREEEFGIFTEVGYIESMAEIKNTLVEIPALDAPPASINLIANLPMDNKSNIPLSFPSHDDLQEIYIGVHELGATSIDEINFICTDCVVPQAINLINDSNDIYLTVEFAQRISELQTDGLLPKYKAMLDVANCSDLESAMSLSTKVNDYILFEKAYDYESVAERFIPDSLKGANGLEFSECIDLCALGAHIKEKGLAKNTDYGVLARVDQQAIKIVTSHEPEQGMSMY